MAEGNASDLTLPLPGFGPTSVVATTYTDALEPPQAWKREGEAKRLSVGPYTVQLLHCPPDWKAVRQRFPSLKSQDKRSVRQVLWNGVPAWMVDLTLEAQAHPDVSDSRHRYLIAPVGQGFLMMSFRGPTQGFEDNRDAMRTVALAIRFEVTGLIAAYHDDADLEHVKAVRVHAKIDNKWGGGGPGIVGPDQFSVRWTGSVRPRHSETYTFITLTDDGVRLWVDDKRLIDNWTDHGTTEDQGHITLEAGKEYPLKMEWYENSGGATARLLWESDSQEREVIPPACLLAKPEPGFALAPQPASEDDEAPENQLPDLLFGERPGGYETHSPPGFRWEGQPPEQQTTLGKGENTVAVSLRCISLRARDARAVLPAARPGDETTIRAVLWQGAPAWTATVQLNPEAHPAEKQRHQRYFIVPLESGLMVLAFRSADPDWLTKHKPGFLQLVKSVELTDDRIEAAQATGGSGIF